MLPLTVTVSLTASVISCGADLGAGDGIFGELWYCFGGGGGGRFFGFKAGSVNGSDEERRRWEEGATTAAIQALLVVDVGVHAGINHVHSLGLAQLAQLGMPLPLFTREQVAARILAGESLIVYRNNLLLIPISWLDAHPGGSLTLLHFVGRDATDEIDAYHPDHVLKLIPRYSIGTVQGEWIPLLPPVMAGWLHKRNPKDGSFHWFREASAVKSPDDSQILLVENAVGPCDANAPTRAEIEPPPSNLSLKAQAQYSAAYKVLHQRVKDAGLYQCRYTTGYGPEILRYTLLASLSAWFYYKDWIYLSAIFLGFFWHQLVFTAHDLGHAGVSHIWQIDRIISIIIADWFGGLSIGWWVDVSTQL